MQPGTNFFISTPPLVAGSPVSILASSGRGIKFGLRLLFLCSLLFSSAAGQPSGTENGQSADDLIHHGDILDIDVVGSFEFDWRGGITPEGYLDGYDRIAEPIFALCRTEKQVADAVAAELGKILRTPVVTVRIIDRTNRPVGFLSGAVRTPQRFQIRRDVSLRELLILAGGIGDNAGGGIRIFRSPDAGCSMRRKVLLESTEASDSYQPRTIDIKIADLLADVKEANPNILTGDIITVLETLPVYVVGGVRNPGQVDFRENLTLSRAIAAAGGTIKGADEEKVVIHRRDGENSIVIEADLRKISADQAEDPRLQAFDIIELREKRQGSRRSVSRINAPRIRTEDSGHLPLRIID